MRPSLAIALVAVALTSGPSALAAEAIATIAVDAGTHDRLDTPLSIPIGDLFNDPAPLWLQETTGGNETDVPCQIEVGTPPRLCFVLAGRTPAGTSRTFRVWPIKKQPPNLPRAEVRKTDQGLDVTVGGRSVLRYHTAMVEPPEGVEATYTRNAYIHPAWTPSGLEVTDDFPPDHKHQRGIWFSWTKTEFEGRHPDFWNMKGAAIRFTKMGPMASGPVFASFQPHHEHVDLAAPGGAKAVLNEAWDVRVWNVGGPQAGYWLWDLVSTQRCASASPVKLPKYYYGGQGYRGHRAWLKEVSMMTSEGKTRKDGNETKARWLDVSGPLDGKPAGCLILIHPSNFRYPQPLRLNPQQPQICIAPSQEGEWQIMPGTDYVSRYRFVIHDGPVTPETAERLWRDFAEPPAVRVSTGRALEVCLLSGSGEYRAEESLTAYKAFLEANYNARCTLVKGEDKGKGLPGIEAIENCDVMLVFARRVTLPKDQLKIVQAYCDEGRPVVGVRTASHAFQNWLEFDKRVLGGNYQGHYGSGPKAEVAFQEKAAGHPILAGVEPFASAYSLYRNTGLAGDVTLLASATAAGKTEPVAWTRTHNGGRVFYTSLGGPDDFRNPGFKQMLVNALFWTANRSVEKK